MRRLLPWPIKAAAGVARRTRTDYKLYWEFLQITVRPCHIPDLTLSALIAFLNDEGRQLRDNSRLRKGAR